MALRKNSKIEKEEIDIETQLKYLKDIFTKEELENVRQAFTIMRGKRKRKPKQIRKIVPFREWVNSPYYLGNDCYGIYDYWKDELEKIVENEYKINQVIFTGAIGCLKTDTLYSTSKGFKTLKELIEEKEDFNVLSEGSVEKAIVSKNHNLGIRPTKKITLSNGTILEGTHNHKIKVLDNNGKIIWKQFDELRLGDNVIHSHKKEQFGKKSLEEEVAYSLGNNITCEEFPKHLLEFDEKTISAFIKGLFNKSSKVSQTDNLIEYQGSISKQQIKRLLSAFGINSHLRKDGSLIIKGYYNLLLFRQEIGYVNRLKVSALNEIISKEIVGYYKTKEGIEIYKHIGSEVFFDTFDYFIKNKVYLEKVESIEDSEAEVGDIEVPTTHCYNLGGIISHNTGKTTASLILIIRRLYELSCYENISALFKLFGSSIIAFAFLSVNKETAFRTGFTQLKNWLDTIPYFQEHFKRRNDIDSSLIWTDENLIITFGSTSNHFIGMNLLCSVLDEANFFQGRQEDDANFDMNNKVSNLYNQIRNRSASRFMIDGVNYSLSIVSSSSTVRSSFTNQLIEQSINDPHTYIVSPAIWEVKPNNYKNDNKFLVFTGDSATDPCIVNTVNELSYILGAKGIKIEYTDLLETSFAQVPENVKREFIFVPESLKSQFSTGNIVIALQDLAGFSVSSSNKLFSSNEVFDKNIDFDLEHPFSKEEIFLSTTTNITQTGYLPIKSYLKNGFKFRNPFAPRFMHLDLSLTGDSTGISMCHIAGWRDLYNQDMGENIEDEDGNYAIESQVKIPIIEIDFMLCIKPPKKPQKISFGKIRDFIVYLRNEENINIEYITADQFQSAQLMQELQELGFTTGYQSVDRTADAYLSFVNLLYEDRIKMYNYEPFRKELFNLVYYAGKKKVDHLIDGSKDISDSVVGSVYNAIQSIDKAKQQSMQQLSDLFIDVNKGNNIDDYIQQALEDLSNQIIGRRR